MKIIKLEAENIKRLKAVEITPDPDGNLVIISGKNDQGKTSVLDSIWFALGGKKTIQARPIRLGEDSASVTIDLGDYIVERSWTADDKTYLAVRNAQGASFPSPQALLDRLVGDLTFDPLAFSLADKTKQIDILKSAIDVPFSEKELQSIAVTPFISADNPLDTIQSAYDSVFSDRSDINRDLKTAQGAFNSIHIPKGSENIQSISSTELFSERRILEEQQTKKNAAISDLGILNERRSQNKLMLQDNIRIITELNKRLRNLEREHKELSESGNKILGDILAKNKHISEMPTPDFSEIDSKISAIDETSKITQLISDKQKASKMVDQLKSTSDSLTSRLNSIKHYKDIILSKTEMPIPGLSFSEEGVTFNDLPFNQLSQSEQLKISMAIAMSLNPELRIIRFTDASLLDSNSMKVVEQLAKDNDYQCWLEVVDETGKLGVYIEDGTVK